MNQTLSYYDKKKLHIAVIAENRFCRGGDNAASLHLKKAKTHQATGITQSSSLTVAAKNDLSTVVSTRHAASVVPPEKEKDDIIDVDGSDDKSKESESDAEHEHKNESAEDQLSMLMNALYN